MPNSYTNRSFLVTYFPSSLLPLIRSHGSNQVLFPMSQQSWLSEHTVHTQQLCHMEHSTGSITTDAKVWVSAVVPLLRLPDPELLFFKRRKAHVLRKHPVLCYSRSYGFLRRYLFQNTAQGAHAHLPVWGVHTYHTQQGNEPHHLIALVHVKSEQEGQQNRKTAASIWIFWDVIELQFHCWFLSLSTTCSLKKVCFQPSTFSQLRELTPQRQVRGRTIHPRQAPESP